MAHVREVERKTGRAYEVRWRDGGKFRQRSFAVKREAERFALTVENEQHAGNSTASLVKNTKTLRQVAEEAMNADRPNRKQKTMDGYEVAYRVHIYLAHGGRRISTITAADVQQFIAQLRTKPKANGEARSETSVLGTYKALAKVFSYAMKHRLITYNPCTKAG